MKQAFRLQPPAALRNLPAPAKINLFLHVTGRRDDGYHLLETVFQFIDLLDYIDLDLRADGNIVRARDLPGVSSNDDITVKAARLLQQTCNVSLGVTIGLTKQIPMGGGLGGGSSDAATVLLGLNHLWSCGLSRDRLAHIGLQLGADVPVFVHGASAYATGVGEKLRSVQLDPFPLVLVTPSINVPTVAIFRRPELTRNTEPITMEGFAEGQPKLVGRNDLEPVAAKHFPAVKRALNELKQVSRSLQLDPSMVRMSGSGACVFVKCQSLVHANAIAAKTRGVGKVQVVWAFSQHPLQL